MLVIKYSTIGEKVISLDSKLAEALKLEIQALDECYKKIGNIVSNIHDLTDGQCVTTRTISKAVQPFILVTADRLKTDLGYNKCTYEMFCSAAAYIMKSAGRQAQFQATVKQVREELARHGFEMSKRCRIDVIKSDNPIFKRVPSEFGNNKPDTQIRDYWIYLTPRGDQNE